MCARICSTLRVLRNYKALRICNKGPADFFLHKVGPSYFFCQYKCLVYHIGTDRVFIIQERSVGGQCPAVFVWNPNYEP